jgi:hypothetical protein
MARERQTLHRDARMSWVVRRPGPRHKESASAGARTQVRLADLCSPHRAPGAESVCSLPNSPPCKLVKGLEKLPQTQGWLRPTEGSSDDGGIEEGRRRGGAPTASSARRLPGVSIPSLDLSSTFAFFWRVRERPDRRGQGAPPTAYYGVYAEKAQRRDRRFRRSPQGRPVLVGGCTCRGVHRKESCIANEPVLEAGRAGGKTQKPN